MKKILLIIFLLNGLLGISSHVHNYNKIDSLKLLLNTAKIDTSQIKSYLNIGDIFNKISKDSSLFYFNKALVIAEDSKQYKLIGKSYHKIGVVYYQKSKFDSAIFYWRKAVVNFNKANEKRFEAAGLRVIGIAYRKKSDYKKSYEYYQKSLEIYTEIDNKSSVATVLGNIGLVWDLVSMEMKYDFHFEENTLVFSLNSGQTLYLEKQ